MGWFITAGACGLDAHATFGIGRGECEWGCYRAAPETGGGTGALAHRGTPPTKSCALRQMSIAVQPAANAPKTAEQSETHHAGVGWPMYVTQPNALQKSHEQNVQNG